MPNHVYNRIKFEGDKTEIEKLFKKAKAKNVDGEESEFTFNAFVPMPEKVYRGSLGREEEKQYPGLKNWYGWRIKYWGTKSDCYEMEITENTIEFETAWSPPYPVLRAISKQFHKLKLHYFCEEPLTDLKEHLVFKAGRVLT